MNYSNRFYNCVRCHQQVIICTYCDRGNIYCSGKCAKLARKENLKQAGRRYQNTARGKLMHAARQAKYKRTQNKKMTHQGSPVQPVETESTQGITRDSEGDVVTDCNRCHFCKKNASKFLRYRFLDDLVEKRQSSSEDLAQGP